MIKIVDKLPVINLLFDGISYIPGCDGLAGPTFYPFDPFPDITVTDPCVYRCKFGINKCLDLLHGYIHGSKSMESIIPPLPLVNKYLVLLFLSLFGDALIDSIPTLVPLCPFTLKCLCYSPSVVLVVLEEALVNDLSLYVVLNAKIVPFSIRYLPLKN